jgi:hypothetical protein
LDAWKQPQLNEETVTALREIYAISGKFAETEFSPEMDPARDRAEETASSMQWDGSR